MGYRKRNIDPDPVCPTCGKYKEYRVLHGVYIKHGRVYNRPARNWTTKIIFSKRLNKFISRKIADENPTVRTRVNKKKYRIPFDRVRKYAFCSDPFHDYISKEDRPKEKVIPPKVHNPDLTEKKKLMKRDLQGKHRR